jgi:tellurite resistance protein TerC
MHFTIFNIFVILMLIIDLKLVNRNPHEIKFREAMGWSAVWISVALLFYVGNYFTEGHDKALEFLTAYLIEKSLSIDNIFVFMIIFSYFRVPKKYQHKVLFWGILGALIMRAIFIAAGVTLISKFHWLIYIFGAFLVFTGIKMLLKKDEEIHPEKNPVSNLFRRFMPVTKNFEGGNFFVRKDHRLMATPLFIPLIVVETTDVIFATDSVPAVLAVSLDPFIVYTSNILAILGLRALFFALAGIIQIFHHLHYGISAILVFVGVKMLVSNFYKIPTPAALGVLGGILFFSIISSLIFPAEKTE